ncbi:MAG: ABC transporter permease [Gemmatimonadota bacterium]|nr:ABC transporter permease [Gemmatimonadota bacterium]
MLDPERVDVARVDQGYAPLFSLRPEIGRLFAPAEFEYGAHNVVVLTHALWTTHFSADRAIIGRQIVLDDVPRLVIGVLPSTDFSYPSADVEALMPLALHPKSFRRNRGNVWLGVVGRMRPGVSLVRARAELLTMSAGISIAFPDAMEGISIHAEPLTESALLSLAGGGLGMALAPGGDARAHSRAQCAQARRGRHSDRHRPVVRRGPLARGLSCRRESARHADARRRRSDADHGSADGSILTGAKGEHGRPDDRVAGD